MSDSKLSEVNRLDRLLRDAKAEGFEDAALLLRQLSVDEGTRAEGANEPEFSRFIDCEAVLWNAMKRLEGFAAKLRDPK